MVSSLLCVQFVVLWPLVFCHWSMTQAGPSHPYYQKANSKDTTDRPLQPPHRPFVPHFPHPTRHSTPSRSPKSCDRIHQTMMYIVHRSVLFSFCRRLHLICQTLICLFCGESRLYSVSSISTSSKSSRDKKSCRQTGHPFWRQSHSTIHSWWKTWQRVSYPDERGMMTTWNKESSCCTTCIGRENGTDIRKKYMCMN